MGDYLVMTWPPGTPSTTADVLRAELDAEGVWRLAYSEFGLAVYVRGKRAPSVQPLAGRGGVVVGDLFDRDATQEGRVADLVLGVADDRDPLEIAGDIVRRGWGRYVAVLRDRFDPPWVLRDPTGALECLTWRRDQVTLVSSDVPATGALSPEGLAIDWDALGDLMARHGLSSQICPLRGVTVVAPGMVRGGRRDAVHRLWSPADFARQQRRATEPAELATVVDGAVAALARDRQSILVEISGGLDSAIVAASLAKCGAPVARGVNYYWPQPEGDERAWARAIAERCGFPLIEVPRDLLRLDADVLMRHAHGPRPGFNAQDPDLDDDLAGRAMALGADALFSGQGGDGVFYQMVPPALAVDILAGRAPPQGRMKALTTLARRARTTVWQLGRGALSPASAMGGERSSPLYLPAGRRRPAAHAWVVDRRGVSRAKQVQILGLANAQTAFGDSLRGRAATLTYPLMSQPVMELCLSIPAPRLAIGEVDRPFARAAFADRLPPASLSRRSKGAVTKYFARSLAARAPALRDFLIEGRLVEKGMILAAPLQTMLDVDEMIWRDDVGEVFLAAYLEAWVRVWEAKLAGRPAPDPRVILGGGQSAGRPAPGRSRRGA